MLGLRCLAADFVITDYGADPGGTTLSTGAIQKAIDLCSKRGGSVIVPPGTFLTGTLVMKDNVTLDIRAGALLLGSPELSSYPEQSVSFHFWGEQWARYALIVANKAKNISITGCGVIDGQGSRFKLFSRKKPDKYRNRPYLIWFAECSNVSVSNVTLRNSAFWMQYYLCCDNVRIDGIRVFNHSNKNNDMIDIDGCHDVTITNVTGDSDDDGITLKSTCPRSNENVVIDNCILSSHCNALKLGTESTGGFRNVAISNVIVRPSQVKTVLSGSATGISGIALEVADGGRLENVSLSNIIVDSTAVPLFVRLCNRARKYYPAAPEPSVGILKGVHISGLRCLGLSPVGCSVTGIPGGVVEDISLNDCSFSCVGGVNEDMSKVVVPEMETAYPESSNFGTLPAYGLYFRHARNIRLSNVHFELRHSDSRPAMVCDDVADFINSNVGASGCKGDKIMIKR